MKRILIGALALSLLGGTAALAQPGGHDDHHMGPPGDHRGGPAPGAPRGWKGHDYGDGHHFKRGERVGYGDWNRYQPVDYREHHLRKPPRGYEWRRTNDGQYVLAAVATGIIAAIILGNQ